MKLLRGSQSFSAFNSGTVATIGNFDGVHRGHRALLSELRKEATRLRLPMIVILFEPQPGEFFYKKKAPSRLSGLRDKLDVLRQAGVDFVYCLKFDKQLSAMSAVGFAEDILFSLLCVKSLLIGADFKFGKNREGDVSLLKKIASKYAASINIFTDFSINSERVSSTKIRNALSEGDLHYAQDLLGRPYSMCGRVAHGDGRGRKWGIPTANLNLQRITLPLKGVFCVRIQRNGKPDEYGVANIGSRPTVDGSKNILEIHLFDFNETIYGELLHVYFIKKIRNEERFSSLDLLIAQIHNDIKMAKEFIQFAGAC